MEIVTKRKELIDDLAKTWVLQRLKHISLSAVPWWLGARVSTASRYQHSTNVGRLSLLVSGGDEHEQVLLTAAAVLHDIGNGPFPHISDPLMEEMLGFKHEEAIKFAFLNSPVKDSAVLDAYLLDLEEISLILENRHRLSPFLYGFPDLDNADNIYRFIMTVPNRPLGEASYRPEEIAASLSLDLKNQNISDDIRKRWASDNAKVYSYVWNERTNMVGWTMLGRALRLLGKELSPSFFRLTNRQAFDLIRLKLPGLAEGLKRKEFRIVFDEKFKQLKGEARELMDPSSIGNLERIICEEAGLDEWSFGLTVDQPLTGEKADHWRVYLVSNKGKKAPLPLLQDVFSSSEPLEPAREDVSC